MKQSAACLSGADAVWTVLSSWSIAAEEGSGLTGAMRKTRLQQEKW